MKTRLANGAFAARAIAALLITATAHAGDTDPPPGAIDSTMKTLDEVEPRVIVNNLPGAADAEHVITAPGNYYLTGNITAQAGRSAVVVDLASDPNDDPVTIDLNGFSITGQAGSLDGVRFTVDFEGGRYVLRSGVPLRFDRYSAISGMGGHAVSYTGNPALIDGAAPVIISGLAISNCAGDGVHVENAKSTYVFDLTVTDNIGLTSFVSGVPSSNTSVVIENVTASNCAAGGTVIQDTAEVRVEKFECRACGGPGLDVTAAPGGPFKFDTREGNLLSNAGPGIRVDISGTTGATIRVNDTTCANNTSHGIHVLGSGLTATPGFDGATVAHEMGHNFSIDNGGDGIRVELDDTASAHVHSFSSTMRGNAGDGFHCAGSFNVTVNINSKDDDASRNGGSGLHVSGSLTVNGATLNGNGADGLRFTAPGEPVSGIPMELIGVVATNNGGNGAAFDWKQLDGPYAMRVSDSTFTGNGLDGLYSQDDNQHDGVIDISECVASSNTLAGFVVDNDPPAAGTEPKTKTRVRRGMAEHNANGSGFSFTHCRAEASHCSAAGNNGDGFGVVGESFVLDHCNSEDNAADGYNHQGNESDYSHCRASGNGDAGYFTVADAIRLRHCSATGNTGHGYRLSEPPTAPPRINITLISIRAVNNGGDGANIESITLEDLLIDCREMTSTGNSGNGIHVLSAGAVALSDATLQANGLAGAFLQDVDGNSGLDRVRAAGNGAGGLVVSGGGTLDIDDGSFSDNTGDGATVEVSGTLTVSGATMCGNTGSGLVHASTSGIPATSVSIDHCVCSGNDLSGILVSDSFGGRVQHCSAYANGDVGIEVLAFSHVVTNNMCGNNTSGNYAVTLPGNALGPIESEATVPGTDNASNYQP